MILGEIEKLVKIVKSVQSNADFVVGNETTFADFIILRLFIMLEDKYFKNAYAFLRQVPELAKIAETQMRNPKIAEFVAEIREKQIPFTGQGIMF